MTSPSYDVVVPSVGRATLERLLDALLTGDGPQPAATIVVDDRPQPAPPLLTGAPWADRVKVVTGRAAGPAAARNDGWRAGSAEWVAFLDDDVELPADWRARLAADLAVLGPEVGASQGRIRVPRPADRRPTDWERNVAGLEHARWATADMAYRRTALAATGGFDERFPRAYREDADLGLRVTCAGWRIVEGEREVRHPASPAPWWVSLTKQRGNVDDALMTRLHGRGWRERSAAPRGRLPLHAATTAAWVVALAGALSRGRGPARAGLAAAVALTGELTARRVAPGPRTPAEIGSLAVTSALIPPLATGWRLVGEVRARRLVPRARPARPRAVLFDRDGTLVEDEPYNGDPAAVRPVPGARAALDRLRAAGIPVGIVSNQSGVARGLLDAEQVEAVNGRVEELLGPFAAVVWCPHGPDDGCRCRKPGPGLVEEACRRIGVEPGDAAVVGDIGADVGAAVAAGARPVLVPTPVTRSAEVEEAPEVVRDLATAVDRLLGAAAPRGLR